MIMNAIFHHTVLTVLYHRLFLLQNKFPSFNRFAKTFNTDDFDYDQLDHTDFVFMRWKVCIYELIIYSHLCNVCLYLCTVWLYIFTLWLYMFTVWLYVYTVWLYVYTGWLYVCTLRLSLCTVWVYLCTVWHVFRHTRVNCWRSKIFRIANEITFHSSVELVYFTITNQYSVIGKCLPATFF